jgi:hypothetical protein
MVCKGDDRFGCCVGLDMVEIGGEPRMVLPFLKVFLFADII